MKISLVVPVLYEEDAAPIFYQSVLSELKNDELAVPTKSNGYKLLNLFLGGVTTLSILEIRMWEDFGLVLTFLTFIYGTRMIIETLELNDAVRE